MYHLPSNLSYLHDLKIPKGTPISQNASEQTKQLLSYLHSIQGKNILSGQQYLQSQELEDLIYYRYTGKLPAIRGYDLMDMDKKRGDNQLARAIAWAKQTGSIITFCWHWYAPDNMDDMDNCMWSFYYKTTDYNHKTSFDLLKAVKEGTKEYEFVLSRIDKAALMLKELEKENIPVLWRPLHEANGAWFWWGIREDNPVLCTEAYFKLWYMIFDRMENHHKLSNLIWVWNGQSKNLLPHPNTYDIAGDDIYSDIPRDHSPQAQRYHQMRSYTPLEKPLALSECGYIPDPDCLISEKIDWLWWLPWWGQFVYEIKDNKPVIDNNNLPLYNSKYLDQDYLMKIFSHPYVLTLQDLPWYAQCCNHTTPPLLRRFQKIEVK